MRGKDRRQFRWGRRAADKRGAVAVPLWVRIGVLITALGLAGLSLIYAQEMRQAPLTASAQREASLRSAAAITAARLDADVAQARLAVSDIADSWSGGRAQAQASLDTGDWPTPVAVFDGAGDLIASEGAEASLFAAPSEAEGAPWFPSADRRAILVSRADSGGAIVARVSPRPPEGVLIALFADGERVAGEGRPPAATADAVAVSETTGLSVRAYGQAATGGAGRWTALWQLLIPIVLGGGLTLLLWLQGRRTQTVSRVWEDTERRFRVAVEAARCGVWEWDLGKNEVVLSDYMATLLGLQRGGAASAEKVLAQVNPQHRDRVVHALRQAAAYGTFEVTFRVDPEGEAPRWIDARGQARGEREDGRYVQILGVALDITEARRARALAVAAQNRLQDAIESVSDAFVLFDRHGRLVLWNEAFADAFGFADGHLKRGAMKDELNRIASLAIKGAYASPTQRAGVREVELNDGRWLQMSERFTSDGGTVVSAADITLIKQSEAARQKAAEWLQATVDQLEDSQASLSQLARKYEVAMVRAEAANQAKSEFLANMSHELRTPLNAINGFSEIMAGEMFGPLGDPRYKGYAADILGSGQHLLSLINDILDMAKIEAGKLTLRYEDVRVKEVCQDAIRLMRGRAEEAELKISLEAENSPDIEADYRALKQVMVNLLSNAVKFTPAGGRITVSIQALADRVRVAVADTGIGISAEDLPRLATPFEQVEGQHSKTTQGTGLGLALTKSLVELHGGELVMESELGVGTTISVVLPVRKAQAGEPARIAA